jgi:two-component system repressor protein LuxO
MSNAASVLIIEDSAELLVLYQKILAPLKCHITTIGQGAEAIEYLQSHRPDVIVTDLTLPDMTTEEFYEKFIAVQQIDSIPLILISGRDDLFSWKDLFGAVFALKKPTDVIRFRECVKNLTAASVAERPLEA